MAKLVITFSNVTSTMVIEHLTFSLHLDVANVHMKLFQPKSPLFNFIVGCVVLHVHVYLYAQQACLTGSARNPSLFVGVTAPWCQ